MDDQGFDVSTDDDISQERSHISLVDLPVEVFLHICSFLDSSTLVHSLSLVCKQFYEILRDDSLWKGRISQVWPNARYPVLPPDDDDELFWKLSCVAVERQASLWRKRDSLLNYSLHCGHYGTVDTVLLINNARNCISGGRDRLLICWTLQSSEEVPYQMSVGLGHDGWIWEITSVDGKIYSCSWDKTVRSWDIGEGSVAPIRTYDTNVQGALLCINSCPELNYLATGSFCKTVTIFDPRGDDIVTRYQPHQRAVIQISVNSNYVISASEDKTVVVWDIRAGRTMKTIQVSKDSFPMSMFVHNGVIYIGDSNSNIHILDEKSDFKVVKSYKTEHTKGITGIQAPAGCIMTASLDRMLRIHSPTDPPQSIANFRCQHGDITSMHYSNEVLAASADDAIEIWRSNTAYEHCL